jgi:hypothetical protein
VKDDPHKAEREARAQHFRSQYCSGDASTSNTAPYFIGVWDTVNTLGAGTIVLIALAGLYVAGCAGIAGLLGHLFGLLFWPVFAIFALGVPGCAYLVACFRYHGLASLARYRMAFYDTSLHYAVRYARHAIAIDENRASFEYAPWDEHPVKDLRPTSTSPVPERIKQVWFAGSHSDVGGSYPETESRLSDIALAWVLQEARSLPTPIMVDHSVLKLFPDSGGPQHDEREAFFSACPGWMMRICLWFVPRRSFGWREGQREVPLSAILHPTVVERFRRPAVLIHGDITPYRPSVLRNHPAVAEFYSAAAVTTSSVTTLNPASLAAPKLVESATSVASRPRAMSTRPIRGALWRASKVYQRPSR